MCGYSRRGGCNGRQAGLIGVYNKDLARPADDADWITQAIPNILAMNGRQAADLGCAYV